MKHYEIVVPLSFDPDTPAFCITKTREATKDEIIEYLEEENSKLYQTLAVLKDYCGEDYISAARELQAFLETTPMRPQVICFGRPDNRTPFVTAASQESLRRGKEHACKPTRRP